MKQKDPCKVFACKIQECLKKNGFQEPSCQQAIEEMQKCCLHWKDSSYVCDGFKSLYEAPQTSSEKSTLQ